MPKVAPPPAPGVLRAPTTPIPPKKQNAQRTKSMVPSAPKLMQTAVKKEKKIELVSRKKKLKCDLKL